MATTDQRFASGTAAFQFSVFRLSTRSRDSASCSARRCSRSRGGGRSTNYEAPLNLPLTGLVQLLPGVFLFLLAGQAAERFNRRKLVMWCYAGYGLLKGV
jgi:hypothetical protein